MKSLGSWVALAGALLCISNSTAIAEPQNTGLPEVACHYILKITDLGSGKSRQTRQEDWYFWRQSGMVQTANAKGDFGEIWQLTKTGHIYYQKLYYTDKTAVEYMPADNEVNHLNFDWLKLANMLSTNELQQLKTVKKLHVLNREAEIRVSKSPDQQLRVEWLVKEQLPAKIVKQDKYRKIELRLVEITAYSQARFKPVDDNVIADYRHIDAADFGDMENDAFVNKVH